VSEACQPRGQSDGMASSHDFPPQTLKPFPLSHDHKAEDDVVDDRAFRNIELEGLSHSYR